jgi:cullin-4
MAKLAEEAAVDAVVFLGQMVRLWKDHCSQMLTIRSIFLYLDRTYVITSSSARSLFDMGLELFRTHLQSYPQVPPS